MGDGKTLDPTDPDDLNALAGIVSDALPLDTGVLIILFDRTLSRVTATTDVDISVGIVAAEKFIAQVREGAYECIAELNVKPEGKA